MNLNEKADVFEKFLVDNLISPDNTLMYLWKKDTNECTGYSDMTIWTGVAAATFAMKYECLRRQLDHLSCGDEIKATAEAKELAIRFCEGLFLLHDVTGKPGLLARGVRSATYDGSLLENWNLSEKGGLWEWLGDVSTDQLVGWLYGMSVCYELLGEDEPEANCCIEDGKIITPKKVDIRDGIRQRVCAVADHLIENNMKIIDIDGKRTKHGDLKNWMGYNGLNCLIGLAVFRLAMNVSIERKGGYNYDKYWVYYNKLISKGYHKAAIKARSKWYEYPYHWYGKHSYSDDNMAFLAYGVLGFAGCTEEWFYRSLYKTGIFVDKFSNPFWESIYAGIKNNRHEKYHSIKVNWKVNWIAPRLALCKKYIKQLSDMRIEQHAIEVNPEDKFYEIPWRDWDFNRTKKRMKSYLIYFAEWLPLKARGKRFQSWNIVDINDRKNDSFEWKENPYRLEKGGNDHNHFVSRIDFLSAYWAGKYFDLL